MRKISSSRLASMLPMGPSFQMPAECTSWSIPPSRAAASRTRSIAPRSVERSAPTAKARPGNRAAIPSASPLCDR